MKPALQCGLHCELIFVAQHQGEQQPLTLTQISLDFFFYCVTTTHEYKLLMEWYH